jgi:hypothetical protein
MRVLKTIVMLTLPVVAVSAKGAENPKTYTVVYVVTPSNVMLHVFADGANRDKECKSINSDSITPELVSKTGAHLNGWSFVKSERTFGYVTWISEKSGVHTTFLANYILANCSLTETRLEQKSFDGQNRYADANGEYSRLILKVLGSASRR